uniref:Uncharacterized protein n=1 Tax=Mus musculus TaxID=10090 RepID=Q3TN70_MOUSE|nr:unnamed protein product [Mus musculus]
MLPHPPPPDTHTVAKALHTTGFLSLASLYAKKKKKKRFCPVHMSMGSPAPIRGSSLFFRVSRGVHFSEKFPCLLRWTRPFCLIKSDASGL